MYNNNNNNNVTVSVFIHEQDIVKSMTRAGERPLEPKFVTGGASRFDLNQGEMGKYFILSILSFMLIVNMNYNISNVCLSIV